MMNEKSIKTLLSAINKAYPSDSIELYNEWIQEGHQSNDYSGMLDYISDHLPEHITAKQRTSEDDVGQFKLSNIAQAFTIRNNPALFKKHYATGFHALDEALGGGFVPGVNFIGAGSSLGKSTFAIQLMYNLAKNHIRSIYFSMEMSGLDIAAKLISFLSFNHAVESQNEDLAKTANDLRKEEVVNNYTDAEWQNIQNAVQELAEVGEYATILDSMESSMDIDDIEQFLIKHIKKYNDKPFLIIDYLQLLRPSKNVRGLSDKQVVDYNVYRIREISAKYDIPILGISSFNRAGATGSVRMEAFKASGEIEFSSDILLGIQFSGCDDEGFDINEAKSAYPRQVEFVILKNRYGETGTKIKMQFYTKYNYFVDESSFRTLSDDEKTPFDLDKTGKEEPSGKQRKRR